MTAEVLRATQAARRLGIPTLDLLYLVYEQKIRYVMVEGIPHIPGDAIEEYERPASRNPARGGPPGR